MGRPRGSYNKEKCFRSVLRKVLLENKAKELHEVVKALVTQAKKPDLQAIDRIADRLDGKIQAAAEGANNPLPGPIGRIENVLINPQHPEGEQEEILDPEDTSADGVRPAVSRGKV
jgi:hypothetical protein